MGCISSLLPASAQVRASLKAKQNVVYAGPDISNLRDTVLGQRFAGGDTIQTGRRSQAVIEFSDKSIERINEITRILISSGTGQRDARVTSSQGEVYGKYKGPGRFSGKFVVCAVRGTEFELLVTESRDIVRCFSGLVYATRAGNQIVTGRVTIQGGLQFSSADLIGTENWTGARIEFLTGPDSKQRRKVANFDPATGTITLDAAVNANNLSSEFLIINPGDGNYVLLEPNTETYVPHVVGADPVAPYPTQPQDFAGGDELAFMNEPLSGNQQSHLTGFIHERFRKANYQLDNGRDFSHEAGDIAPGIQPVGSSLHLGLGGDVTSGGSLGVGLGGNGSGNGNVGVGIGNGSSGNGNGGLIVNVGGGRAANSIGFFPRPPQIGGIGFSTTSSDSILGFANTSAVLGGVYLRVGGRFGTLDRTTDNQLDELLLRYRNAGFGDIQIGRFHWFPGPVSNGQLGKLVSFTTADGILWQPALGGTYHVQLGWFDKINPLNGPRVGGYSARFTLPVRTGQLGVSALTTAQKTVGVTGDFVYPILPQKLEIYGEGGVDTSHQTVYTVGIFLPELFHRYQADLSLEYSYRGHFGPSIDLDIHLPVGRHFTALLALSKPGAASWRPSIGVQAKF